jgi:RNA recognition motif-containing protein
MMKGRTVMGTKLYVGNLSWETSEGDVERAFADVGQVADCNLIVDRFTSKSRGFAFVNMATQEDANKAVAEMNGKDLDGRALVVNEARPREEGGGGGGGGGRGGRGGGGRDRY